MCLGKQIHRLLRLWNSLFLRELIAIYFNMRQFLIPFLFFLLQTSVFSQNTIYISNTQDLLKVGKDVLFLEDLEGNLSLADILKTENQVQFQKNDHDVFNRPAIKSAFWFKFTISNQSQEAIWLEIGDAFTSWNLDFYAPNENNQYSVPTLLGSLRPQTNKQFSSNYYCVELAKGNQTDVKTYYLKTYGSAKVQGNFNKTYIFQVGTLKALAKQTKIYDYMVATFIGLIIAILIYNLFLFYSTRANIYLLYIFYLLTVVISIPFHNGYPLFYASWLWEYYHVWVSISYLSISLFSIYSLNLKELAPRLNRWVWILTFFLSLVFPVLNLSTLVSFIILVNIFQFVALIYYFTLLYCGIYIWKKGDKSVRFYILAWFFLILGVFIFILAINGILPLNTFTHRIMYLGFSLEALLFGLAIGDKYNQIQKEKEKIQLKNIVLIKEKNQLLEEKVAERTRELQGTNEELQVINEELSQTQEELKSQRDFLDEQNITLRGQNTKIQDSIRSAELIQKAILPYQSKLDDLLADYFIINRPKDVVSGDFYWLNKLGDETILVVADCTGHGVPGAFMTLIGSNLLDKIVEIWKITSPNLILEKLHQEIKAVLHQDSTESNIGMDAAIITFKKESNQTNITFSGAKNSLFYFHSEDKKFYEIKGTRKSIGGRIQKNKNFENSTISLPKGSILYLGTDGLQDQNNKNRKRFGSSRLKQTFEEYSYLPLDGQKAKIEAILAEYMKDTSQRDDILWLGMKV